MKIAAWKVQRANSMLMCDECEHGPTWPDKQISKSFGTTPRRLEDWRKQAALQGPLSPMERKQRATPPTLDGGQEARLTNIACFTHRNGRSRWTLQKLADRLVALEMVESISADTVGRVQENEIQPWLKSTWCIPPKQDAAFVASMKHVFTVSQRESQRIFASLFLVAKQDGSKACRRPTRQEGRSNLHAIVSSAGHSEAIRPIHWKF